MFPAPISAHNHRRLRRSLCLPQIRCAARRSFIRCGARRGKFDVRGNFAISRLIMWNWLSLDGYFVVLGGGKALFGRGGRRMRLNLLQARPMPSGAVILRYEPRA
jgi:hypothetical protein